LLPENFNTYNIIEKDDIVIRPTDLQNDKKSLRTGISKEHGIITSAYIAMKAIRKINSEYFHYLLHTYDVMKIFYNMGNGVRQGLNFSEFSKLMVFEPPVEEQEKISAYLDKKCTETDNIISGKKHQIHTMEDYKKSLIFEYVTGKRKI
ncbi:MAG: restriction endonuclease subunit S, partial [Ruminococcus sp.]|nr:restriction endonuclease subunit S [Ruminococcus sp.]